MKRRARVQAAKVQERRGARRRRLRRGMIAGAGVVLGAGALAGVWAAAHNLGWGEYPIRNLRVEAAFVHVSLAQVSELVAPYAAQGFFQADVRAIKQALESLPWVRAAAVRRVWPDELQVRVVEQEPAARWGEDALLNSQGEAFHPEREALAAELPLLQGPEGSERQVMERYRALSTELAPLKLSIAKLQMDERRAWQLTLANGIRLVLGREDGVERLGRFVRFYSKVVAGRAADIGAVDLRYTNGFAVTWRATSAQAARPRGDAA